MPNLAKINMKVAGSFARTCKSCSSQFTRTPSPMRHPQPPGFLEKFLVVRELLVCCFPEIHRGTVEHRGTTDKLLEENSTPNRHKKQHFPASSCADSHRPLWKCCASIYPAWDHASGSWNPHAHWQFHCKVSLRSSTPRTAHGDGGHSVSKCAEVWATVDRSQLRHRLPIILAVQLWLTAIRPETCQNQMAQICRLPPESSPPCPHGHFQPCSFFSLCCQLFNLNSFPTWAQSRSLPGHHFLEFPESPEPRSTIWLFNIAMV